MKYDPSLQAAVFLGPSLDADTARAVLPANYYPPVRMGDIYRLSTCGVRLIVIIDGVFHNTAPVWQREILAAIANGVTVVGAASMGALRAVELAPFGMIGLGTIVEWYQAGDIEGDDEVALLHADAEFGYVSMSEPLVNIRYTLNRAADAGLLTKAEESTLAAAMKALDCGRRSYLSLLASDAFAGLPRQTQSALKDFVAAGTPALKARDAIAALEWCAKTFGPEGVRDRTSVERRPRWDPAQRIERPEAILLRGVLTPDGELVTISELLARAVNHDRTWAADAIRRGAERFFLINWMRDEKIAPPAAVIRRFDEDWTRRNGAGDRRTWLAANGMTETELQTELEARAAGAWLREQGPAAFNLERPFLEAWAASHGVDAPRTAPAASFAERMIERGPQFFGFDMWSPDIAVVRELQMTGRIAQLAGTTCVEEVADAGAGAL